MNHLIRTATGWAFLAYFAAVSFLGTGLHGLVATSFDDDCHTRQVSRQHGKLVGQPSPGTSCCQQGPGVVVESPPADDEHDRDSCLVCEHLAKSLSRDAFAVELPGPFCRPFRLASLPDRPLTDWPSLHLPRGPPAFASLS